MLALTQLPRVTCQSHTRLWTLFFAMAAGMVCSLNAVAQEAAEGSDLYNTHCAHCHGGGAQGGTLGPNLLPRVLADDDAALETFLRIGNPAKGMPPAPLADAEFAPLLAWLRETALLFGSGSGESVAFTSPGVKDFEPVSEAELLDPDPADWLWFSRTPDAQRFSPLDQINRDNVAQLGLAWSRSLPEGVTETIPTVHDGVMYLTLPGGDVAAFDATNGDVLWEYRREYINQGAGGSARSKTLAIYEDLVFFTAPDATIVALDARTGAVRWEASVDGRGNTTGAIVVKGKVLSSGTCGVGRSSREDCNITAHDARTGELAWRFLLTQGEDDPGPTGVDTWYGVRDDRRRASSWGLPGSFDVDSGILYWSVANPSPYTRLNRHGGPDVAPLSAPVDLYSNSTLAIDPDNGALLWYYQHLPGDDWDADMNEERILLRTTLAPDPAHVRWINPALQRGEERDIVVNIGEPGGLWALDRLTGEFLWATPFPEPSDSFLLSDIDVNTGATVINRELILDRPGAHRIICYFNTRSYWPGAYSPKTNSLYMSYVKNCLNMTAASPASRGAPATPESRIGIPKPGVPLSELNGLAKVNMETGEITQWPTGPIPNNSAILATAGDLVFWGDINRRYRAQDAESGEVLWETILGGPVSVGNITYAVNGRQYLAVVTGQNLSHPGLNTGTMGPIQLNLRNNLGGNALYVFALPLE